ncbi:MAG TPA: hypothetical protein VKD72_23975 [Gemmataceae bacterium]|nr:hypothetical protein [Gemmataceae bacterium]
MKLQLTGALRRSILLVATSATAAVLAMGVASPAGAYGGGARHDMWQVGISGNCNNPSFCGADGLGGFWGWVEFDRFADGSITGDAQLTGCGHFLGGGGGGAGHSDVDVTSAHIGPSQPQDPNFPNGQVFYVDHNVVNGVTDDPDFLGDSGIPVEPGHYSFHPAPGVADMIQVSFRAAK